MSGDQLIKEELESLKSEVASRSWRDGFFWGILAAIVFALSVVLIVMRWHA